MDEEKKSLLNRVLEYDAIDEAEKLLKDTGLRNEASNALGFLLFQNNRIIRERLLKSEGDFHFGIDAINAMKIIKEQGFTQVLTDPFYSESSEKNEVFIIYWHPEGFLLTFETYRGYVNMAKIYFEIVERKKGDYKQMYRLHASGGFCKMKASRGKMIFCGDIDVREGLKLQMQNVREAGKVKSKWKGNEHNHFLWLIHHQETHDIDEVLGKDNYTEKHKKYDQIEKQRIQRLPDYVRKAIWR